MIKPTDIAILLFSHTAEYEAKHKLWKGIWRQRQLKKLSKHLYEHTLSVLGGLGLDVKVYNETTQVGHNFGERLVHAHQEIFAQGYKAIITVGSDCPQLGSINWDMVVAEMCQGTSILGPDHRGGVYIMGLQSSDFDPVALQTCQWQTSKVYADIFTFLPDAIVLTKRRDINGIKDIVALVSTLGADSSLRQLLMDILADKVVVESHETGILKVFQLGLHQLRAPPIAA